MGKIKYRLKGHESFTLRDGWLTKGMKCVAADNKVFSINSGADALGVGTNMAKSIRYWMKTAGLTKESSQTGALLTCLGELILKWDPYIEDIFTLWILHANIVMNFELATSWNLFFNKMDLQSAFSREEMHELLRSLLLEILGDAKLSERSIRDDCAAILSMYSKITDTNADPEDKKVSPFESLGLISHSGGKFIKKRPSYEKLDEMVILYLIVEKLNADNSIQIDYLTEESNMPGKVLNINRIAVNEYLDRLMNRGYITVNRTAGLDIIYPQNCKGMTKESVIQEYYERGSK